MGWFWLLLILFIVFMLYKNRSQDSPVGHDNAAMEILKKRYANGEITREQFEEMKKELQ